MGTKVHSPWALTWLAALFFIEASFFVIPVDPLLILYCVEDNKRSFYYATIATTSSVIGGVFGYFIGSVLWNSVGIRLVNWLISESTFNHVVGQYALYQNWAVLVAGLTPIPYKAVTISAGFCKLSFLPFVGYSLLARGARFFALAGVIYIWGAHIKKIIDQYFNYLVIAFVILIALSFKFLKGA